MTDVKPGQIWADNDRRSAGRTLRVERIEGTKALCTILTNATAVQAELDSSLRARRTTLDRRGQTARISLARFRPSSTGYRLLTERPEADASDVCGSMAPTGPAYFCEKPFGHSGNHSVEAVAGLARHTWPQVEPIPTATEDPPVSAQVFSWDWKAQPDLSAIAAAVAELSRGQVFMRQIDTRGDNYAWVVSDTELTDEQAWRLYLSEDEEPPARNQRSDR